MPTYFARASGNVNAAIWSTTPTGTAQSFFPFASGDVLVANSFTVTLNVNTDLGNGTVTTDNRDGATPSGLFNLSTGITLTANVVAGPANSCVSAGSGTIVGSVTGGTGSSAASAVTVGGASSVLNIIGNVTGGVGSNASGVAPSSTGGTIIITGNVTSVVSNGCYTQNGPGGFTINGNVTGSATTTAAGLLISGTNTGTYVINGTATGGTGGSVGVSVANIAVTVTVARAKGGPLSSSAVGVASSTAGSLATITVNGIEYGDTYGASPTSGPIRFPNSNAVVAVTTLPNGAKKLLADSTNTAIYPAASDVRSGTTYAASSTGTCAIPAASNVLSGVPVDAGVGTGSLTAAALWNHLTSAATTSGSMGERLASAATVASTGQQIANAVGA